MLVNTTQTVLSAATTIVAVPYHLSCRDVQRSDLVAVYSEMEVELNRASVEGTVGASIDWVPRSQPVRSAAAA